MEGVTKESKALGVVIRALRQDNGLFDIEACWTIGVLAAALDIDGDELATLAQKYYTVKFDHWGDKKIQAIKIVREYTRMGLKAAKEFVEGAGTINASADVANGIKERCEAECGSTVTVRSFIQAPSEPVTFGVDLNDQAV